MDHPSTSRHLEAPSTSDSNMRSQQQETNGQQPPPRQLRLARQQEQEDCGETLATGEPSGPSDVQGRHHVGPVMGIFFKVWSLVKVNKVRQQKLRRQQSDSAHHQFQYIPGAQMPAATNHHYQHHHQLLQDDHFRRAGSQPVAGPSNRLQVVSSSSSSSNTTAQARTPGTNSTSSGVSSAGSTSAGSTSGHGVRRHLSAYSLRRSTAAELPPPSLPQGTSKHLGLGATTSKPMVDSNSSNQASTKKPTTSWASKIRRSATSVNQTDFSNYVSRYKFSANRQQQQQPQRAVPSGDHRDFERARRIHLLSCGSSREDECEIDDNDEDDNNQDDDQITMSEDDSPFLGGQKISSLGNQEEEDSQDNDIYSTPNDSIQSVPSGQQQAPGPVASLQLPPPPGQHHPIIKSFSTSNFSSLLLKQHLGASNISPPQPLVSHSEEAEEPPRVQEAPSDESTKQAKRANLQGSRFFISSSSSEDSQSAKQHNTLTTTLASTSAVAGGHLSPATSCLLSHQASSNASGSHLDSSSMELHSTQRHLSPANRVALQLGIHYHAPVARPPVQVTSRPDSLLLASITQPMLNPADGIGIGGPVTVQTPGYSQPLMVLPGGRLSSARWPQQLQIDKITSRPQAISQPLADITSKRVAMLPNSVSLHDCNYHHIVNTNEKNNQEEDEEAASSEYRLAQMLLESGAKPNAKDSSGHTALMLAVMSDNLAAVRCLLERQAVLNETNQLGLSALDLVCQKPPTKQRLDMLRLLVEAGAELDRCSTSTSLNSEDSPARLLDRLIRQHHHCGSDKLPYIELLLQSGAKLGSSTWLEAHNKQDIQLRLLKKLCQDGYFLYKKSSIEAAVFRFEYALKRIAELEQQLAQQQHHHHQYLSHFTNQNFIPVATRQIKYQTYLGLSRCERKRKFYKRALEFAHLAILVDSTSYEGFYSKAHILKDLGELDDALLAIYQTARLVEESAELLRLELRQLEQQEESLVFSYGYDTNVLLNGTDGSRFESARADLTGNLEYLEEAKRFIGKLKSEILEDKLTRSGESLLTKEPSPESSAITIT